MPVLAIGFYQGRDGKLTRKKNRKKSKTIGKFKTIVKPRPHRVWHYAMKIQLIPAANPCRAGPDVNAALSSLGWLQLIASSHGNSTVKLCRVGQCE